MNADLVFVYLSGDGKRYLLGIQHLVPDAGNGDNLLTLAYCRTLLASCYRYSNGGRSSHLDLIFFIDFFS